MGGGRKCATFLDELIFDPEGTLNNRFTVASSINDQLLHGSGPFWGCPQKQTFSRLHPKKPDFSKYNFSEFRIVEQFLRHKKKQIMTVWQLLGSGSVGSQVLTGLPILHQISKAIADRPVRYWPFDTAWEESLTGVILTEIWPSLADYDNVEHQIKDARQVIAYRNELWDKNMSGQLTNTFARPTWLTETQNRKVLGEEGWILVVGQD